MPPLRRSKHWLSPHRASDFYSSARSCSLHYQSPLSSSLGDGPITVPGAIFRARGGVTVWHLRDALDLGQLLRRTDLFSFHLLLLEQLPCRTVMEQGSCVSG